MALQTTTYQCPNCNGRLHWNGELGKLQCEYCDSTYTNEEVERFFAARQAQADAKAEAQYAKEAAERGDTVVSAAERAAMSAAAASVAGAAPAINVAAPEGASNSIETYLAMTHWSSEDAANLRAYNCPACGAQLMVDQTTAVTSCPYCGNNAVVPGQLADVLRPDYVIPFKVTKQQAIDELKKYYKGKRFLPNAFTERNHIEEIQGVYVPFWLYSGTGEADVTFNATNSTTWSDRDNIYTKTDHYALARSGRVDFKHVPVDASTKMPDEHMDAIEPYDYKELVPFDMSYLPGFVTDRYDQDVKTSESRATQRAANSIVDATEATAGGYESVVVSGNRSRVTWQDQKYALLPVWMLHTRWDKQDFLFAMNGQTGKFIGDLPIDNGKVRARFLKLFLVPAAIIGAIGMAVTWVLPAMGIL